MKKIIKAILSLIIIGGLTACVASQKDIFEASESQAGIRSIQSRVFDFTDRNRMLRTVIATLQDLGFIIDNADETLGTVSGTKLSDYVLRMTVSVRPKGASQMIVRSSAQYNLEIVKDPEPYQQFFLALSKALFLETNVNSVAATPQGTESPSAARVVKDGSTSEKTEPLPESVYPKQNPQIYQVPKPWAGEWKVESTSTEGDGIWAFEQELHIVKSTKVSYYKLRGTVKGNNQLEGKLYTRAGPTYPFVLSIAADGQSFEGKLYGWQGKTSYLKGTKNNSKKAASPLNIFEPWTGKWKVEGHYSALGLWELRQKDNTILSTENSAYEIKGQVIGSQFKGKLRANGAPNYFYSVELKMSLDGQSFQGTATGNIASDKGYIKGRRE